MIKKPRFLLISLLLIPTAAKVHETISFKYQTAIATDLVHRYSTKRSWSKTRQDILDDMSEVAQRESDRSGKPIQVITDKVINERAIDERFRGRLALTYTIGKVVHKELINALLSEMALDDIRFVQKHRDTIKELQLQVYTKEEDVIECTCDFMNMMDVVGMGFELSVAMISKLVTSEEMMEDEFLDGTTADRKAKVISDSSTYNMLINVHFVTGKGVDKIVDKVVQRTNVMLVVTKPKLTKEAVQNMDIDVISGEEKKKFFEEFAAEMAVEKKKGLTKSPGEIMAEIEYEKDIENSLKEEELREKERQAILFAKSEEAKRKEVEKRLKYVEDVIIGFEMKMDKVKSMHKDVNFDEDEEELLWIEIEHILEKIRAIDVETLMLNNSSGHKIREKLAEKAQTDLDMEKYMLEMKFGASTSEL